MGKKKKAKSEKKKLKKLQKLKSKKKKEKKKEKKEKAKNQVFKTEKDIKQLIIQKHEDEVVAKKVLKVALPIEKSINFNVKIATEKIRDFICDKSLNRFVKGDTRITVKKAVLVKKRQLKVKKS